MRSCPRSDVDCVYTPVLEKFLPDLVPKCKSEDKVLRKTQDLLLDVAGPIAMSYEMVWQAMENAHPLDLSILLSCLTRSLQLLGNVNNHLSAKRRTQILSKIDPKYSSLSNESWKTNGRELPGHSGEGENRQQPSPFQTTEESSSWYRYVPRTLFNTHGFKTTYRGQNFSFLSELAEHYERHLGSGYCSGVQDRVSGIPSPVLHSQEVLSLQQKKHAIHKVLELNGHEPS